MNTLLNALFLRGMMDAVSHSTNPYLVCSNTSALSEAKVVILLSDPRYRSDSDYNQSCIRQFYQEKDIVLVEDDEAKGAEALDKRQIYALDCSAYHIEGWDNHAISSRTAQIRRIADRVHEAARKLFNPETEEAEQIECYIRLKAFMGYLKTNRLDEKFSVKAPVWLDNAAQGNLTESKGQGADKAVFLKACSEAIEKVVEGHVAFVFPKRREALKSKIAECCKRKDIGKIFICTSLNFFDPRDRSLKADAERMVQSLGKTPYAVLNPSIQRAKSAPIEIVNSPKDRREHRVSF